MKTPIVILYGQRYDVTSKGFWERKCYSLWFSFILQRQSEIKAERQKKKEGENETDMKRKESRKDGGKEG